jgi:hypothetical protein
MHFALIVIGASHYIDWQEKSVEFFLPVVAEARKCVLLKTLSGYIVW